MYRQGIGALVVLGAVACDPSGEDEPGGDVVLFVAGTEALDVADLQVERAISDLERPTRVVEALALSREHVDDPEVGAVYVAASVSSASVVSVLYETRKPVVVAQSWVADDLGIVASDAKVRELNVVTAGEDDDLAAWVLTDADHPARGELPAGPVSMWEIDGATVVQMVHAPEGARVLATFGSGGPATLLVYERGDTLADDEPAPGRRALFPHEPRAPALFTDDAKALLAATLDWAF